MTKSSKKHYTDEEIASWPHYHIAMLGITPELLEKAVFAEDNIMKLYVFYSYTDEGHKVAQAVSEKFARHFCSKKDGFWSGDSQNWSCDNRLFFISVKFDDFDDIREKLIDTLSNIPDETRITIDVTCGRKVMTAAGIVCAQSVGAEVKYLLEDRTDEERKRPMNERYITIDHPKKPDFTNISDKHLKILKIVENLRSPSKTAIAATLGCSSQAVSNHIEAMIANNLLVAHKTDGRTDAVLLTPNGRFQLNRFKANGLLDFRIEKYDQYLGAEYVRILEKLREIGTAGTSMKDMANLLMVPYNSMSAPFKGLANRGFVEKNGSGRNLTYHITEAGLDWLVQRTSQKSLSEVDSIGPSDIDP